MDRRVYDRLQLAIGDLNAPSSFMRAPVRQAKDEARLALVAFQAQPLSAAVRQASVVLGDRLEAIDPHQPGRNWEPLRVAWEALQLAAVVEEWD